MERMGGEVYFGKFRALPATAELFGDGKRICIQDKPFRILEMLLQAPRGYVSRERLQRQLWPEINADVGRCLNTAVRKLRKSLGDTASAPQVIETVGNRGYRLLLDPVFADASMPHPSAPRIILGISPLHNLNEKTREYFCSGLTEQLIVELGRISRQLTVVTLRGNESDYKWTDFAESTEDIYELSGSVQWTEECFRITVRLTAVKDGSCRWAECFTRKVDDLFAIQDEIARQISRAIQRVLPVRVKRPACMRTASGTYDKYLMASYFIQKGEERSFLQAATLLKEVLQEDSGFAPAYASLAQLYAIGGQYGMLAPRAIYDRVHELADQALRLNPVLPEAHAALGFEALFYHADFAAADRLLSRALLFNPSCVQAQIGCGFLKCASGSYEDSVKAMEMARHLEPHSLMNAALSARAQFVAGHPSEAMMLARRLIEMEPRFPTGHSCLGWILLGMNRREEAIECFRRGVEFCPQSSLMLAHLAFGLAADHQACEAEALLERLLQWREHGWVSPYWIALAYQALNRDETALKWFDRAIDERDGWRVFARSDIRALGGPLPDYFDEWIARIGFRPAGEQGVGLQDARGNGLLADED